MSTLHDATQINVPMLRKALEFAEAHPEETDLRYWARRTECGTTACLAGTVVTMASLDIDWDMRDSSGASCWLVDGRHICEVAVEILGITEEQEDKLFFCSSLDQAWKAAEELTNGEIQRPLLTNDRISPEGPSAMTPCETG